MRRLRFVLLISLLALVVARGQAREPELLLTIGDEEVITAAWAPDSTRIAYALYREIEVREKKYRRDELWVADLTGKKKRLVEPDEIWPPRAPGGYSMNAISWSPDGTKLAVEATSTEGESVFFLFDQRGKRLRIGEGAPFAPGYFAAWLGDSESVAYLSEALKPRLLFAVELVRPRAGTGRGLFEGRFFSAAAWQPRGMKAALIERDREFQQLPRLLIGDLSNGEVLSTVELKDGFVGGLRFTSDGQRVAYFVKQRELEVRNVADPSQSQRVRLPLSPYEFTPDGSAIFYLEPERAAARRGRLTRLEVSSAKSERVLGERMLDNFWISADGKLLATIEGELRPVLKVYRLMP